MKTPKQPLKDHKHWQSYFIGYIDCFKFAIKNKLIDPNIVFNMGSKFRWHIWHEYPSISPGMLGMYLINDGTCTFIAEWNGTNFEGVEGECKWMYLPE